MYKILIIGKTNDLKKNGENVKHINLKETIEELGKKEYDLLYLTKVNTTNKMERCIFSDYTILPKLLNKLAINNDRENTYINLQIINKLIMGNLKLIEFEKFDEGPVIAFILKEMLLYNQINLKEICKSISVKMMVKMRTKRTMKRVICRSYSSDSLLRKMKYFIFQKRINKQFFEKIMNNIRYDISVMESL